MVTCGQIQLRIIHKSGLSLADVCLCPNLNQIYLHFVCVCVGGGGDPQIGRTSQYLNVQTCGLMYLRNVSVFHLPSVLSCASDAPHAAASVAPPVLNRCAEYLLVSKPRLSKHPLSIFLASPPLHWSPICCDKQRTAHCLV